MYFKMAVNNAHLATHKQRDVFWGDRLATFPTSDENELEVVDQNSKCSSP